jgi:hypothetical protein
VNNTLVVTRTRETSINIDKFKEVGSVIDFEDFIDKAEGNGSRSILSKKGREKLNEVFHASPDTAVNVKQLLKYECYIIERNFNDTPVEIDLNANGCFIPDTKVKFLETLTIMKKELIPLYKKYRNNHLIEEKKSELLNEVITSCVRYFHAAIEIEDYHLIASSLAILVNILKDLDNENFVNSLNDMVKHANRLADLEI